MTPDERIQMATKVKHHPEATAKDIADADREIAEAQLDKMNDYYSRTCARMSPPPAEVATAQAILRQAASLRGRQ